MTSPPPADLIDALALADFGRGLDDPVAAWGRASEDLREMWRRRAAILAEVAAGWAAHREAASVALIEALESVNVPASGQVLFLLHTDDPHLDVGQAQAMIARLREITQSLAPGRSHVIVLGPHLSLQELSEANLGALGLRWTS